MKEILKIETMIRKQNYDSAIECLNDKDLFYYFVSDFNNNIKSYTQLEVELRIKIILNITNKLGSDINTDFLQLFYEKVNDLNNNNINLINKFIKLYDNFLKIKNNFFTINFYILNNFKRTYPQLNFFLNKKNLDVTDLGDIKSIVDCKIVPYFNSIFDTSHNNNFFKRISNCRNEVTKNINSREILNRLKKVVKLFSLKILSKLNINIISNHDYHDMTYNQKVNYIRICYCKTFPVFKQYSKLYNLYFIQINKILNLIKIDPLTYTEQLNSSVSSITKSDSEELNNYSAPFIIEEDFEDTPIPNLNDNSNKEIFEIEIDNSINDLFLKN